MFRPPVIRAYQISLIILTGIFLFSLPCATVAAEVSIGTIIDTIGMVDDRTTITMGQGNPYSNGSAMVYRDSQMTNGGALQMTKSVAASGGAGSLTGLPSTDATKVLHYDAAGTGSHIAVSEDALSQRAIPDEDASARGCTLSSSSGEVGSNQSTTASASLDIHSASSLQLTTSTKISTTDLHYSVSANTTPLEGNNAGAATISSAFTYDTRNDNDRNRMSDRSMVSGLFDLFTRVYHAGAGAGIQAQTQGTGMVSSKTVAEHEYASYNRTGNQPEWTGTLVYTADILTNGGNLDETRKVTSDKTIESDRILTYGANGSHAIQTEERVVAVKDAPSGQSDDGNAQCVLAGADAAGLNQSSHQTVTSSSLVFGVESVQLTSSAQLDIGSEKNGSSPLVVDYRVDITSPILFDPYIVQSMTDPNNDGKYEDLNGNGRRDMQDLILLFKNFEWLSKSSISSRFDYNLNGKVDLADLTWAFKNIAQ
jgi:PKD repeat protein